LSLLSPSTTSKSQLLAPVVLPLSLVVLLMSLLVPMLPVSSKYPPKSVSLGESRR